MSAAVPDLRGFAVAPLVIGNVSRGEVEQRIPVYASIVEAAARSKEQISFIGDPRSIIPAITPTVASDNPNAFGGKLRTALESTLAFDVLTLLDLTGLADVRGVCQTEAANAISEATTGNSSPLLILVDEYPPAESPLETVVSTGGVGMVLVAADGRTSRSGHDNHVDAAVLAAMQRLVEAPIDRLRRKLIRAPGWFERTYEGERAFGRNWYDGEFCQAEIVELLLSELDPASVDLIVITPDDSTWLESPAAAVSTQLELPPICHIADFAQRCENLRQALSRDLKIALLTPMVDSGTSITEAHATLVAAGTVNKVEILSILSTRGRLQTHGSRRIETSGIEYRYLVRVRRDVVNTADEECLPLTHSVPITHYRKGLRELSVYEFWDLITLCGTRDEENVPPHRITAGSVPDIEGMVQRYGAWIATRLMNVAKNEARADAEQMLFVCPQEPNSELITDCLQDLYNVSVVRVPRAKWLSDKESSPEQLRAELEACRQEDWIRQLEQASWADCILLDEFTSTGETLEQLRRIVCAVGLRPLFSLVIVDMRPHATDGSPGPLRTKVRALYTLRPDESGLV